jgi:hypothetical protein
VERGRHDGAVIVTDLEQQVRPTLSSGNARHAVRREISCQASGGGTEVFTTSTSGAGSAGDSAIARTVAVSSQAAMRTSSMGFLSP